MNELLVPYKLAVLAKEKGFDETCLAFFNPSMQLRPVGQNPDNAIESRCNNSALRYNLCTAPLYQQLVDWFLFEHGIIIRIRSNGAEYEIKKIINTEWIKYRNSNTALKEAFNLI